jgi:hypothetical protein
MALQRKPFARVKGIRQSYVFIMETRIETEPMPIVMSKLWTNCDAFAGPFAFVPLALKTLGSFGFVSL